MRRYWSVAGAIVVLLLAGFLVVEGLGLPLLSDPTVPLEESGPWAGFLALALLAVDAVLPVPSSLVMVALGAIYGPVLGILLALLGRVLMALAGFAAGRRGGPLLNRLVSPEARIRADSLLERWGVIAIMITRPVPLLAETVVILAGASSITWGRLTWRPSSGRCPRPCSTACRERSRVASVIPRSCGSRSSPWSAVSGWPATGPSAGSSHGLHGRRNLAGCVG